MAGEKPAIKLVAKHKQGRGQPVAILAGWRGERGINARLDRAIASVTLHMADGSTVTIDRDDQGRESHWLNVYDNSADSGPPARQQRQTRREAPQPDDFPDDDGIPF